VERPLRPYVPSSRSIPFRFHCIASRTRVTSSSLSGYPEERRRSCSCNLSLRGVQCSDGALIPPILSVVQVEHKCRTILLAAGMAPEGVAGEFSLLLTSHMTLTHEARSSHHAIQAQSHLTRTSALDARFNFPLQQSCSNRSLSKFLNFKSSYVNLFPPYM
jgi:hypothetical protein